MFIVEYSIVHDFINVTTICLFTVVYSRIVWYMILLQLQLMLVYSRIV